ncbi:hypothetical protein ACP70R_019946 [Stipagrostis hirtigluma subsp. patula]
MEKVQVLIVGAGPSGLAVAACLRQLSIPYAIVEREDCSVSLWRKRTYDRLRLHLAKEFCELPHMPYPNNTPTYVPKEQFVRYVDSYIKHFNICPIYSTSVQSCEYDEVSNHWVIMAHDQENGTVMEYAARFLVVASGENSKENIPEIQGLNDFPGEVSHSSSYKSWNNYAGKSVLVVGCGNSGMDIAYDLASHGVETSIVIRSPFNVMTKGLMRLGMTLANWKLSLKFVDSILVTLAYMWFGDLSKYGIIRPNMGPLLLKEDTGQSAVIDVGTIKLIRKGVIKVLGPISCISGSVVNFEDGKERCFDSLLFATGYRSTANTWLKDGESLLNDDGMPKNKFPNHWKGENGLYCVGLGMRGIAGISRDAKSVAEDIKSIIESRASL